MAVSLSLEKIKTIGDNYHIAAGVPEPHPSHARAITEMAIQMNEVSGGGGSLFQTDPLSYD